MAHVLNRTTKEYIRSANTGDYPVEAWIINPDLSAVDGFPDKYWVITGDVVSLMDQAQRDAVDAGNVDTGRDAVAALIDRVEAYERAFALALLDELNAHSTKINAILTAIDNGGTLAQVKTNIAAIADLGQRSVAQMKTAIRGKLGS
jgi:hypothetical protein